MDVYKKYIKEYDNFPIDGVKYLDLNPLYQYGWGRNLLVRDCVLCSKKLPEFDYIGVVESRGYIIGSILAHELNKGLVMLRSKPNRLPGDTSLVKRTIGGAIEVLTKGGYDPIGALFLVEITKFNPTLNVPYESIVKY